MTSRNLTIAPSLLAQVRDFHIVVEATLLAVELERKRKPFFRLGFELPVIWIDWFVLMETVVQNPQNLLVRAFRTKKVKIIRVISSSSQLPREISSLP
jgi:hypothetical protein